MKKNNIKFYIFSFIITFFILGCNIFSFYYEKDTSTISYSDWEKIYQDMINENNYDSALSIAKILIDLDSNRSDGYYLYAKAYRYKYFNRYFLLQEYLKTQDSSGYIPLWDLNIFTLESIYVANRVIKDDLQIIVDRNLTGNYTKDDILGDLLLSTSIVAFLSLKDIDGDGSLLDDTTFFKFFNVLLTDTGLILENLDSLVDYIARPEVINTMIDRADTLLGLVVDYSDEFITDTTSLELIDSVATEIKQYIVYYKIADGIDNDGDGRIDEEDLNGKDDDGDGLIDEDSRAIPEISLDSL